MNDSITLSQHEWKMMTLVSFLPSILTFLNRYFCIDDTVGRELFNDIQDLYWKEVTSDIKKALNPKRELERVAQKVGIDYLRRTRNIDRLLPG